MNGSGLHRRRRVLLLEPDYANKYPPIALMKFATYHRERGWDVVFWKGDLDRFVAERLTLRLLDDLAMADASIRWGRFFPEFRDFVWKGKSEPVRAVQEAFAGCLFEAYSLLAEYRERFRSGEYFEWREWDRVLVTTLFTFYADITIRTIQFAKRLRAREIMVGGVMASVVPDYIEKETGIRPFTGVVKDTRLFRDRRGKTCVDDLPLDYSILEEIDYRYPSENAHFAHTTRGCPNHCAFCAVPVIEPQYQSFRPLVEKTRWETERFGPKPDLLLMDNNVFASRDFPAIVEEIKRAGFDAGTTCTAADPLRICQNRIHEGFNPPAYVKKGVALLQGLLKKGLGREEEGQLRTALADFHADRDWHGTTPNEFFALAERVQPIWQKHWLPRSKRRTVDFNQGLDSRISSQKDVMSKLAELPIHPVRIAFDHWTLRGAYEKAVTSAARAGFGHMSNYVLYNFNDTPEELYWRLRKTIALAERLGVNIYSFPMKYHPIKDPEWFSNRHYLGPHWCRKFIRFVQIVLTPTLGKVGNGKVFFLKAFGTDTDAFRELLLQPEHILRNRWDCELNGELERWRESFASLNGEMKMLLRNHFVNNDWRDQQTWAGEPIRLRRFLRFYQRDPSVVDKVPEARKNAARMAFTEQWKDCNIDLSEADAKRELKRSLAWPFRIGHDHPLPE
jgi:hypothetical protein